MTDQTNRRLIIFYLFHYCYNNLCFCCFLWNFNWKSAHCIWTINPSKLCDLYKLIWRNMTRNRQQECKAHAQKGSWEEQVVRFSVDLDMSLRNGPSKLGGLPLSETRGVKRMSIANCPIGINKNGWHGSTHVTASAQRPCHHWQPINKSDTWEEYGDPIKTVDTTAT